MRFKGKSRQEKEKNNGAITFVKGSKKSNNGHKSMLMTLKYETENKHPIFSSHIKGGDSPLDCQYLMYRIHLLDKRF
jgi:hypothetical protein